MNQMPTMPTPGLTDLPPSTDIVSVAIGRWAVAAAPVKIRTLLGSCVGVVLYDRVVKMGGVAHIVLPEARAAIDHPGKYADTAIPGMIVDFDRRLGETQGRGLLPSWWEVPECFRFHPARTPIRD